MFTHLRSSLARPGLVLVTGALAVTLAACGGGNSTTAASGSTSTPHTRPSGAQAPPGTFGTAAAVTASSVEVQNQQSGQVTVNFDSATKFTDTVAATLADVRTGACVSVVAPAGTAMAAGFTAQTVTITAATNGSCTAGGFGGGNGGQRGSRTPNPSRQPRPSGANRQGANTARAFGTVASVSATGFTVTGIARGATPATTSTITVNSGTTYTKTMSATSSALAVGDCVAAVGPSDDTGAVTARTIAVSTPGKNGCTFGFGGGRGFRGGSAGGGNG